MINQEQPGGDASAPRARDDDLLLALALRRGQLGPADAHRVARLLEQDEHFRQEARREEYLQRSFAAMRPDPLPAGLVQRAVRQAVGEQARQSWLRIDTLLIGLGVGVGCAATAQFVGAQFDPLTAVGGWLGELAGVAVEGSLMELLGSLALGSLGVVLGAGLGLWRLLRGR